MNHTILNATAELTGRVFLATIFLLSGLNKIGQYEGTQAYMAAAGVPGSLLPLVIVLEVAGALAISLGWQTRIAAWLLAGFTLLAGLLFHTNGQDQMTLILLMKNIAISGGFLVLAAHGAGAWSVDARQAR